MGTSYSIYEAKSRLSELLREVKGGRETVITERGRPIAKIIPFKEPDSFEERYNDLVARGVILPARAKGPIPRSSIHRPGALRRFLADRE